MAVRWNPFQNNFDLVTAVGGADVTQINGDSGSSTPSGGVITIAGGTNIVTSATGSTVTVSFDGTLPVTSGGTGATSLTDGGILLGSGTSAVTVTSQPTNGQLLVGSTGVDPVLATLTEGTGVTVTNGAGSITLDVDVTELTTVATSYSTDSGSAVPAANVLTIAGGANIATSGSGSTVTVAFDGTLPVASGGTGATSYTNGQILIGNTTGNTLDVATITEGSGITVTNGGGSITLAVDVTDLTTVPTSFTCDSGSATPSSNVLTVAGGTGCSTSGSGSTVTINVSGGGFTWSEVTGTSQSAAVNNGYVTNNAGAVTVTLPTTCALGDVVAIMGKGAGGWILDAGGTNTIEFLGSTTSAGGTITPDEATAAIEVVCITANSAWAVRSVTGNHTVA